MRIAVVGASGAVGQELIALLRERDFPFSELRLYASRRSAGREVTFGNETLVIEELPIGSDLGADIVFSSAGGALSRQRAWEWASAGAAVVDNTSAWRLDPRVPLVIPEVNAAAANDHEGVIANPNCSTILALMALAPLHRAFGLKRAVIATYQAVSGAGAEGITELREQATSALAAPATKSGEPAEHAYAPRLFKHPIAFNLFSHDSEIGDDGYNEEERKLTLESRKILGAPELAISATCVRVPVFRAHSEAIHAEFERPVTEQEAREVLINAPGLELMDDRASNAFPTPLLASGRDTTLVGRIRADSSNPGGVALFVAGDQIRKGAALNAVQIAELLA